MTGLSFLRCQTPKNKHPRECPLILQCRAALLHWESSGLPTKSPQERSPHLWAWPHDPASPERPRPLVWLRPGETKAAAPGEFSALRAPPPTVRRLSQVAIPESGSGKELLSELSVPVPGARCVRVLAGGLRMRGYSRVAWGAMFPRGQGPDLNGVRAGEPGTPGSQGVRTWGGS